VGPFLDPHIVTVILVQVDGHTITIGIAHHFRKAIMVKIERTADAPVCITIVGRFGPDLAETVYTVSSGKSEGHQRDQHQDTCPLR
jgi:hypothetical protein